MLTITAKLPGTARSDTLSVMPSWLLLTKDDVWRTPLKVTEEEVTNPVPLIISAKEELLPAGEEDGERLVIVGRGLAAEGWTVKLTAFDPPPPGGGLVTTMGNVPAEARSEGSRVTSIWLPLTNEAAWGT